MYSYSEGSTHTRKFSGPHTTYFRALDALHNPSKTGRWWWLQHLAGLGNCPKRA